MNAPQMPPSPVEATPRELGRPLEDVYAEFDPAPLACVREGGTTLEGWVAYDDSITGPRPGVLIVHQWKGLTDYEKKRAEILQMAALKPEIAILDETDSGLDIDALRIVANVDRLDSSAVAALEKYVAAGGGVAFFAGDVESKLLHGLDVLGREVDAQHTHSMLRGEMSLIGFVLLMAAGLMCLFPHVAVAWLVPVLLVYGFFFMSSYPMVEAALGTLRESALPMIVTATTVALSWTDNANNETAFRIERSTTAGFTAGTVTAIPVGPHTTW